MCAETLDNIRTPFYLYDTDLLARTLDAIKAETSSKDNYHVHYAIKANSNPAILAQIARAGFGADCVSGGEIRAALAAGFPPASIVFAGVGKADWEIRLGLEHDIAAFNVESQEELEVIAQLAAAMGRRAHISLRINPNVGAHTHANITTGLAENKFGIDLDDMVNVIRQTEANAHLDFIGLHFHIGSQLLEMDDFVALSDKVNEIQEQLEGEGINVMNINVGGGLGIDYVQPDANPIPDFHAYFSTYASHLRLRPGQQLHFELGRAVVAQLGSLITRVLYVKQGKQKRFVIVDAGMTELIRPALYGALHQIQPFAVSREGIRFGSTSPTATYDVVGPICESSDVFAKDYAMPTVGRGDLLALRSAGAYGEVMASTYNCRPMPDAYTTQQLLDRVGITPDC